jgi:hypothetical protein
MHGGWHPYPTDPFKRPVFTRNPRPIRYPCQWGPGDVVHCRVMETDFTFPEPEEGQPRHLVFESEQELQNYICLCIAESENV